ncbi:alternative ribosome rescue aminoacyl-tRNA hydrolase ArfB [Planctomycetota bacterium]|nr:alternative ribosome rescue aminoacyl-tRNA hydrolase ArfB [Planctomycetota bacterium]
MLKIGKNIVVEDSELEFSFARSGGPGGQHVNKTSSKALLKWNLNNAKGIPTAVMVRLRTQQARLITDSGELHLTCDENRSQHRNREICIERLTEILKAASVAPKRRKPTKPSRGAIKRRQESKKRQSDKKKHRQKPDW